MSNAPQIAASLNARQSLNLPLGAEIVETRECGDVVKLPSGELLRRWTKGLSSNAWGEGGLGWDEFGSHGQEMGSLASLAESEA